MSAKREFQNALLQSMLRTALDPGHPDRFPASKEIRALLAEGAGSDDDPDGLGPPEGGKLVLALTRDEYLDLLQEVEDRQNLEIYDDPDDCPPAVLERRARREKIEAQIRDAGLDRNQFRFTVRRHALSSGSDS